MKNLLIIIFILLFHQLIMGQSSYVEIRKQYVSNDPKDDVDRYHYYDETEYIDNRISRYAEVLGFYITYQHYNYKESKDTFAITITSYSLKNALEDRSKYDYGSFPKEPYKTSYKNGKKVYQIGFSTSTNPIYLSYKTSSIWNHQAAVVNSPEYMDYVSLDTMSVQMGKIYYLHKKLVRQELYERDIIKPSSINVYEYNSKGFLIHKIGLRGSDTSYTEKYSLNRFDSISCAYIKRFKSDGIDYDTLIYKYQRWSKNNLRIVSKWANAPKKTSSIKRIINGRLIREYAEGKKFSYKYNNEGRIIYGDRSEYTYNPQSTIYVYERKNIGEGPLLSREK